MLKSQLIESTFYFLALVNPASKIFFLASKDPAFTRKELVSISLRSTITALLLLLALVSAGNFVLVKIFHVEIYSLSVAGGIILFIVGLSAVRTGKFFEDTKELHSDTDISIVPLATPLIAGAGTMTAAISFASMHGILLTSICVTLALLINFVLMLLTTDINHFLAKFNAIGPLTRITGLIVTTVAMQMIFSGCAAWVSALH